MGGVGTGGSIPPATRLLVPAQSAARDSALLQAGGHMEEPPEPQFVAVDDEALLGQLVRLVDDGHAALLGERRIGQDEFVFAVLPGQCILVFDR